MPVYDKDFGAKLEEIEKAVGFRFPASHFSNTALAALLQTTVETMSRKKKGRRLVTESDWSRLANHFDLARYGFVPSMFADDPARFTTIMREVAAKALLEARPNKARDDLTTLSAGKHGSRLQIEASRGVQRAGGIGTDPRQDAVKAFQEGDKVQVKLTVPADGHLFLLNDSFDGDVTCLMPSFFAPRLAVRAGTVALPTTSEFPRFPVAGPAGTYRLYAIWFAQRPTIALAEGEGRDQPPRDLSASEFMEIAACAMAASKRDLAVMVAVGDYKVK